MGGREDADIIREVVVDIDFTREERIGPGDMGVSQQRTAGDRLERAWKGLDKVVFLGRLLVGPQQRFVEIVPVAFII